MDGIVKRKTTFTLSQDMDRWIEQRDQLSQKVEELRIQRKTALQAEEVVREGRGGEEGRRGGDRKSTQHPCMSLNVYQVFPRVYNLNITIVPPPPPPPADCQDAEELKSVDEDLDSLSAHIDYVQENIVELQNDLIAIDDSKVIKLARNKILCVCTLCMHRCTYIY